MADPPRSPDIEPHTTPRWVKVSGIIALVVILLVVILLVTGVATGPGGHGPSRHTGGLGGHTPPASITAHGV
jgi:hypothetical protein